MMAFAGLGHVWIIGPGRVGIALGSSLLSEGAAERVTFTGRGSEPPVGASPSRPDIDYLPPGEPFHAPPDLVLVAVPDAAIPLAVETALSAGLRGAPVLHTSGVLGADALSRLREAGSAVGSLHPLLPVTATTVAAEFRGAWFGVEGDPEAVERADHIVRVLGGRALSVDAAGKALYHAAAVFASNYVVALLAVGERLMAEAGIPVDDARPALSALAEAAVRNVRTTGPAGALTGPISRGDAGTVALHLERLSAGDARLYSGLAREALLLARARGLDAEAIGRLDEILQRTVP